MKSKDMKAHILKLHIILRLLYGLDYELEAWISLKKRKIYELRLNNVFSLITHFL